MDMTNCECDVDFNCGIHNEEEVYWAEHFRIKPTPFEVAHAYDSDEYKGKYWEGWYA